MGCMILQKQYIYKGYISFGDWGVMMTKDEILGLFESFLDKESLFVDKKVLQSSYAPPEIFHREKQIKLIADILAPALKLDKPSNLFVYGKTGTGKTSTVRHVTGKILEIVEKRDIPLKVFYLNCKLNRVADTEYRLIAQLARDNGKEIPPTGLPTDEVYKIFFSSIDDKKQAVILVLDEIDQVIKKAGDGLIYNLIRINSELKNSQLSLIGISNDLSFTNNLDPRVKSSLSEEELVFPPYNALQIQDILRKRADIAFKPNSLNAGVVEKCAAYAAHEHGDARRALELLRVAGELAERQGLEKVDINHIDEAEDKIEHDRIIDVVATQPKQHQAILYSIISIANNSKSIFTGESYELYKQICKKTNLNPLTQRRVSDIISELDMLGIINAKVISKGRYGRTREIELSISAAITLQIKKLLDEALGLS
jgi:archaeal cell division control protein 6